MSTELTTLSTLVIKGNAINEQMLFHGGQYVIHAAQLGVILDEIKIKENIKTNAEFSEFLSVEMPKVDRSKANRYIQISKQFPDLLDSSGATSRLGYSQVVELLAASEEIKEAVIERIEAGEDVTIKEIQRLKKEAADLLASRNSVQTDLILKTQQADELQRKVNFQKLTCDAVEKQNDELRNRDQALIDAKVAEAKAQLILENQQAIAEAKRQAENAQGELERLKREQTKAIADGVRSELNTLDAQIVSKEHTLNSFQSRIDALRKVENSLEREVGVLQTHKKCIEKIKDNLSFLTVSFSDAFDTGVIPVDVASEWDAIFYAVSKIKKQMAEWRDSTDVIYVARVGELVD